MFGNKKKSSKNRPQISGPLNFEHRVHTGFDHEQGSFVGLPPQWASIVEPQTPARPAPLIDPSIITDFEIQPLKVSIDWKIYQS